MTWHQWHQTALIERRTGLSSACARANAASPHSCHSTALVGSCIPIVMIARFLPVWLSLREGYHGEERAFGIEGGSSARCAPWCGIESDGMIPRWLTHDASEMRERHGQAICLTGDQRSRVLVSLRPSGLGAEVDAIVGEFADRAMHALDAAGGAPTLIDIAADTRPDPSG